MNKDCADSRNRSANGAKGGFEPKKKDVSGLPSLFPANPARRVSVSGKRPKTQNTNRVRAANESDVSGMFSDQNLCDQLMVRQIEESDAEGAD